LAEVSPSEGVWNLGMLPFVYAPLSTPTNGDDLPDLLPFALTIDQESRSLLQMANEAVSMALAKAYSMGSMMSGMMDEGGVGREYAEDFLHFAKTALGRDRLDGMSVLEIGCGTGYFLYRLKLLGANVLGVEPGAHGQEGSRRFGIKVVRDFFPSENVRGRFDVIVLYAILEHIQRPRDFLTKVTAYLKETGNMVISVPDSEPCMRVGDISMLMHEHWNYYTDATLRNTIRMSTGLDVTMGKSGFGGAIYAATKKQHLMPPGSDVKQEAPRLLDYKSQAEKALNRLLTYFVKAKERGESVGIYVPSRAINALSMLKDRTDLSGLRFFDDDQRLQGKYFPGFDIPIEPSENLMKTSTNRILVMSPSFEERIVNKLKSLTGTSSLITTWKDLFMGFD